MILITLGTQDKQFTRLLDVVQNEIDKGNIKDKVIVQAGHTKFESKDMEIFDLIDREKFSDIKSENFSLSIKSKISISLLSNLVCPA